MNKTYKDQAAYLFYKVLLRHCTLESYLDRDNYVQDVFDNHFDNCFSSKFLTKELIEIIGTENFKQQEYLTKQLLGLVQDTTAEMKAAIDSFTDDERTEYLKDIIAFDEELEKLNNKFYLTAEKRIYLENDKLFNNVSIVVKFLKTQFDDELTANVFIQLLNLIKSNYQAIFDKTITGLECLTEDQNKFVFDNIKNQPLSNIFTIAQANNFELKDLAKTILDK